jgi:hypothetical protein
MIIEHRTDVVEHGRTDEYLDRYRQHGLPVQQKYLGRLLGVFVSEIGRLNEVLYIWVYDSLADREERRAKLGADPAWHESRRGNRGTFVQQDVKIMRYASFSPQ